MPTRPAVLVALTGLLAALPAAADPPCGGCPPAGGSRGLGFAAPVGGQADGFPGVYPPNVARTAVPPDPADLARLNLRSEWAAYVPMDGRYDALGPVQWVDGEQVFVQTRAGRLIALDAITGAQQWSFRYPSPGAILHRVAVTPRAVFAVNVNTLYGFDRYTGLELFRFDLPGLSLPGAGGPTAGPVADAINVYLQLGANRVVGYRYPQPVVAPPRTPPKLGPDGRPLPSDPRATTVADVVAGRAPGRLNQFIQDETFERFGTNRGSAADPGLGPLQKTPSFGIVPRVTPPYSLAREVSTPSTHAMASVKMPYRLYPPGMQYQQPTPSISSMPPSAAAALALANLRPPGVEPAPMWSAVAPGRTANEPLMVPVLTRPELTSNLWLTLDGPRAVALSAVTGQRQAVLDTTGPIVAPAAGPVAAGKLLLGFLSQADGAVVAVELPGGATDRPRVEWRANVGGFLNHRPFPVSDAVFVSGDDSGLAKLDLATGEVLWRTESTADFPIAANDEHVYVLDNRGALLVYPRNLPPGSPTLARPAASLDVRGFDVPVANRRTDRVLLAANHGLLVCLRDASAKYARPVRVAPPSHLPVPPPKAADGMKPMPAAADGM